MDGHWNHKKEEEDEGDAQRAPNPCLQFITPKVSSGKTIAPPKYDRFTSKENLEASICGERTPQVKSSRSAT